MRVAEDGYVKELFFPHYPDMRGILFLSLSAPPFLASLYRRTVNVLKCAIGEKKRTTISNDTLICPYPNEYRLHFCDKVDTT